MNNVSSLGDLVEGVCCIAKLIGKVFYSVFGEEAFREEPPLKGDHKSFISLH